MQEKNILILTASIGSGHTRAAEAIAASLKTKLPQANINVVDFMAKDISLIHYLLKRIYLIMLAVVPNIYDVCFKVAGSSSGGGLVRKAFAMLMTRAMHGLLSKYQPTLIVATHPFPEGAAARWRKAHRAQYSLVALMTDYTIHEIWLSSDVDSYFVATDTMKVEMLNQGFSPEKIFVTGIPIQSNSLKLNDNRQSLRQDLDIAKDKRVILIMGGGLGLGGMKGVLRSLEEITDSLTLLIVAGNNDELKSYAMAKIPTSHHQLKVWGYIASDYIHKLMQVADLLITKPGALTLSEAFAHSLPLLLHDPIPGPETENARFATRNGVALWLHKGEKIAPAVIELIDEDRLGDMREAAKKVAKAKAADDVAEHIIKILNHKTIQAN